MRPSRLIRPLVPLLVVSLFGPVGCTPDEPDDIPGVLGPSSPRDSGKPSPEESSPRAPKSPDKPDRKDEKDEPEIVEVKGGAQLTSLPDKAAEVCSKGPPASRACPTLVPLVRGTNYLVDSFGRAGGAFQVVEMAAGAPSDNDFSRNAPPRVAHVVVEVGKPQFLIDLGTPAAPAVPLEDVLGQQLDGSRLVSLDKAWGWNATLILAESFPSGGAHGDHLVYRWTRGGLDHVVSLHAWTPAREAVRTLHAIVRSIKR